MKYAALVLIPNHARRASRSDPSTRLTAAGATLDTPSPVPRHPGQRQLTPPPALARPLDQHHRGRSSDVPDGIDAAICG